MTNNKEFLLYENWRRNKKLVHSKLVFRPEPSKHMKLSSECADFLEVVSSCMELVKRLKLSARPTVFDGASNWQVTSSLFIDRLSEVYSKYKYLIQRVQVAIYEMKLGISLAVSTTVERIFEEG